MEVRAASICSQRPGPSGSVATELNEANGMKAQQQKMRSQD